MSIKNRFKFCSSKHIPVHYSLQSLYQKQAQESSSEFDTAICQFFESCYLPSQEIVNKWIWQESLLDSNWRTSEEAAIEHWKQLLSLNIFCHLIQSSKDEIVAKILSFERHPWNQSSQYFRSLVALNHALAKMPIPDLKPHLLEGGAALLDFQEYAPWVSLPYHPHHLEFGIFLSLLALLTKRQDLKEAVGYLARWQLNTLDSFSKPCRGLFVREKDGKILRHLITSYLLFRSAAIFDQGQLFTEVADATIKKIHEHDWEKEDWIHPLWALTERCLETFKKAPEEVLLNSETKVSSADNNQKLATTNSLKIPERNLSEQIYDPSTALVGYRSSNQCIVCTLHGEHTGLGTLRFGDIEIITYGPQYFPLEECQGFGIEGNALSDHGIRRSIIEWKPHSFSLKGCVRLVDQPSFLPDEAKKFRGIWLDVTQEFKKPDFYLKITPLSLDGWDSLAFSFFVKAHRCSTRSQQCLLPRTLQFYEGEVQTLTFSGQESFLELHTLSPVGTMRVIPLCGGNNFWGADFLVAYSFTADQRHYQWHLGPPHSIYRQDL